MHAPDDDQRTGTHPGGRDAGRGAAVAGGSSRCPRITEAVRPHSQRHLAKRTARSAAGKSLVTCCALWAVTLAVTPGSVRGGWRGGNRQSSPPAPRPCLFTL